MRLTVRGRCASSGSLSINTCDTGRSRRPGDEGFCYLLRCVGRYWHKADMRLMGVKRTSCGVCTENLIHVDEVAKSPKLTQ